MYITQKCTHCPQKPLCQAVLRGCYFIHRMKSVVQTFVRIDLTVLSFHTSLLNLLRPDLIIDRNTFHDMAEPNEYINRAASLVRGYKNGWQEAAYEQLCCARETAWGKKVFCNNPTVQPVFSMLEKDAISMEERVQLISDIENMHTFSNLISRTRRRDIGEFTIRKPYTVSVNFTPEQAQLHEKILSVIHEILSMVHCTDNTVFMMTTIRRQAASCLFGLIPTLQSILCRHIAEIVDDEDEAVNMNALAEALPPDDPKFDALMEIVQKKRCDAHKNKIMIFSSFKHTLRYLYRRLSECGYRVGMIHGEVPDEERRTLRGRFDPSETPSSAPDAIDILLFSEVGCEGLDYQFCDCIQKLQKARQSADILFELLAYGILVIENSAE